MLATWSLAAECAHELPPAGLAWPTLVLAAMLDHHGVPGAVLTSPAACGYITGRPSTANAADQVMVRAAINNLAQAGLVTIDPGSAVRTVQMHASVQAAVRAYLPPADLEQVVLAAADALLQTWPDDGGGRPGAAAGRPAGAGAAGLRGDAAGPRRRRCCGSRRPTRCCSGPGCRWSRAGCPARPSTYWKSMAATSTRLLGPDHANAVAARDRLAAAYEAAGKSADADPVFQTALADREQNLGARAPRDHRGPRPTWRTPTSAAGRPADAIALYERTVADSARMLGTGHPVTLDARASLAAAYQAAGQRGRRSPPTRSCWPRPNATSARPPRHAGRAGRAGRRLRGRRAGPRRPSRSTSGRWPTRSGCTAPTIRTRSRPGPAWPRRSARPGRRRTPSRSTSGCWPTASGPQGADHPDTIAARANLAFAYRSAGRLREAIPLYERTLADRVRVPGPTTGTP